MTSTSRSASFQHSLSLRSIWLLCLCCALIAGIALPAEAQRPERSKSAPAAVEAPAYPDAARKSFKVDLAGQPLAYEATAATLTLRDEAGKPTADIFHIAYVADKPASERPITFAFNGGPGAASAYLHLGAMGPRVAAFRPDGTVTNAAALPENADTWLAFSDLVFVDPVSTGYSRARSEEAEKSFLAADKDADALAEFIRLWLVKAGRFTEPVFLAGESYGGFRAVLLAERLIEKGVQVKGLVLVSPALDFSVIRGGRRSVLMNALLLPSFAAAHHELSTGKAATLADLADVERFALTRYLAHLAAPIGHNPEVEAALARYTGLPTDVVARTYGRVTTRTFLTTLQRDRRQTFSRYDATIGAAVGRTGGGHNFDPVLDNMGSALATAFTHYARTELGYLIDRPYLILNRAVSRSWRYGGSGGQGYADVVDELQELRIRSPRLRVLVVNGTTDLVTTYMASRHLIGLLEPIEGAAAPIVKAYPGGHMMYLRPEVRRALTADVRALYADALGQ